MAATPRRPAGSRGAPPGRRVGRYVIFDQIAAGGMASVHLGKLEGPVGFARTVAVKRLHAHLERTPEFVAMFLDEARLAARVRHPNVVSTVDVVAHDDEIVLVMDYVHGEALSRLVRTSADGRVPPRIASGIVAGVLYGLHAAHETRSERDEPLDIVHRDVSPQNIIVGVDGVARVLDFGIAKATWNTVTTREGQLKGKLSYMAPEQVRAEKVDRRTDVYATSVVLWEALTGKRLFENANAAQLVKDLVETEIPPPGRLVAGLPEGLDELVLRGLSRDRAGRFATAREMAVELEKVVPPATAREIGEWVEATAGPELARRREMLRRIEAPDGASSDTDESDGDRPSQIPTAVPARSGRGAEESDSAPASAATQVSQVTNDVSSSDVVPRPRARRRFAAVAIGAVAVGAAAFVAFGPRLQSSAPPEEPAPSTGRSAEAPPAPPPSVQAESATAPVEPAGSAASAPDVTVVPTARPPPPRSAGSAGPNPPGTVGKPVPPAPPVASVDCNPPFDMVNGIKRYKRPCLK